MLRFFREKAAVIGWTIVILFGGTMFTGSLFFGLGGGGAESAPSVSSDTSFALLGEHPLDVRRYNQVVQSSLTNLYNRSGKVSPIQLEQVVYSAFETVSRDLAFFLAATEANIVLSKAEKKAMEREFLLENNFKSKRDLKKFLKSRKIEYSQFQNDLDRELVLRKYKHQMLADVQINDAVIENSFTTLKLDTVMVRPMVELSDSVSLNAIALDVFEALTGSTIEAIGAKYESVVTVSYTKGDEFLSFFDMNVQVRDHVYDASQRVYLPPLCINDYCLIIKVTEEKITEKPEGYNEEEYGKQLLSELRNERSVDTLATLFAKHPIHINSPDIKAVYSKYSGDFKSALDAYQQLSSNFPSSSVPHFFRAEVFKRLRQDDLALSELEKADIKSQLSENNDFVELHIFYGDVLVEQEDNQKAIEQYTKAVMLADSSVDVLNVLRERYEKIDYEVGIKEIEDKITLIEEMAAKEAEEQDDEEIILPALVD